MIKLSVSCVVDLLVVDPQHFIVRHSILRFSHPMRFVESIVSEMTGMKISSVLMMCFLGSMR